MAYQFANAEVLKSERRVRHTKERQEFPEVLRARDKQWRIANAENIRARRRTEEARKKARDRIREKLRTSAHWNIHCRMRASIWASLKASKGGQRWEALVGYTTADLMRHLERQFLKGMSWENRGEWHIDHIVARASFQFQSVSDQSFRDCWALSNLRPIWASQNRQKGAARTFLI